MKSVLSILKVIWIYLWAILLTVAVFLPIIVVSILGSTGNAAFTISKLWAWVMLKVTAVRPVIRGQEKIKRGQSYVIIANHQSLFDILALVMTLGIQFRWIIKRELLNIPLFGHALFASRNIFIDRSNREKAIASMQKGVRHLPPGASIMCFAEGTRSSDGVVQDFKKGGFALAIEQKFPILPVTVNGGNSILPKGQSVFQPGPMEVIVSDPLDTTSYDLETIDELMAETRAIIISNLALNYPTR
ncbi:lysophospholipid acyltransferase family protein [candidate division CSSED10-310 bacterium]|uniref:1-acyl-sn-glycerol-3-phosphate acyltransferase n=1 Tax=candidate division CSSED10-310 bacterium TaxID=2855610 RepID=A0ABV6Z5G7_UNCC1